MTTPTIVECPICDGTGKIERPNSAIENGLLLKIITSHALFEHGYSLRQIARFLKVKSPNTIQYYLNKKA